MFRSPYEKQTIAILWLVGAPVEQTNVHHSSPEPTFGPRKSCGCSVNQSGLLLPNRQSVRIVTIMWRSDEQARNISKIVPVHKTTYSVELLMIVGLVGISPPQLMQVPCLLNFCLRQPYCTLPCSKVSVATKNRGTCRRHWQSHASWPTGAVSTMIYIAE